MKEENEMKQTVYYIPEIDIIVFLIQMENCHPSFEWNPYDLVIEQNRIGKLDIKCSDYYMIELGEL